MDGDEDVDPKLPLPKLAKLITFRPLYDPLGARLGGLDCGT